MNAKGKLSRRSHFLHAYTLVEVLVAASLIGIMVVSLYAGFSSGFAVVRISREESRATQILLRKIEAVHFCTWSQLGNSFPRTFQEPYDPMGTTNSTFYWGTVSIGPPEMIEDNADYKTNVAQVTVTVLWTNFNGSVPTAWSNRMTTLVARYGAQNYALGATRQ